MKKLIVEVCPETGICSLVKDNGAKTDLMPFEVDELKKLSADEVDKIKSVIRQGNADFAENLTADEIKHILGQIAKH
jgi:hypothetical protein